MSRNASSSPAAMRAKSSRSEYGCRSSKIFYGSFVLEVKLVKRNQWVRVYDYVYFSYPVNIQELNNQACNEILFWLLKKNRHHHFMRFDFASARILPADAGRQAG